ncbi:MAG: DUF4040 domain-containing protein [Fretibacterium sp.]|uniref:Na(+)/H(+) antiporter subunit B n=1 Tax=Fretibacterium sp. OH1220_COT-178 TaxID=2491047 RepID=UPI000F5DA953|nr:hydrogenase subunit MbhD domain-containing protein [Fretibacterium sp. OH1220_COT-178]MDO4785314.1 DUF4040 domain-containing protein [Fretibacterium sp.]RRD65864.1 DUF4040 domain-containing protein [Fretibacterium sp. OH1220_COT-178]
MTSVLYVPLLTALLFSGCASLWIPGALSAVFSFAVFHLLLAVAFYVLGAPDVAFIQLAVGSGLSTIVLVIAIRACRVNGEGGGVR